MDSARPLSMTSRQESPRALEAFELYWALGASRSIDALWHHYETQSQPPPASRATLYAWKSMFQWDRRCVARTLQAASEIEAIRRAQVADMEIALYEKGLRLLSESADHLFARLADYRENGNTRAIGAMAAVQATRLGMELATRGLRQPATIVREEVIQSDGQQLTLDTFLELLPEGTREQILEAAYWELQSGGNQVAVRGDSRPAAELPAPA